MFALDLFNTVYERALSEGAVDDLEARRIHGLNTKMLELMTRAKDATPEMRAALKREYAKVKEERDSYYKIKEAGIPGNVPTEKIPGKEDLLKGKGRSYYEADQKKNSESDTPLDQRLQRLKTQARKQFPRAETDDEALLLKLLDKESQDDRLNRQIDARQDNEIKKNFAFDQEQENEIEDLQAQVGVQEHGGGIGPKQHWQDLMPEGRMSEIDAMRQDLERMNDRQFYTAYGISKATFQQKYRALLKPALEEGQQLHVGDPIVVTGTNEFEGATGEVAEFSPSGKFVVVNLYNHGQHSMHLSDVKFNQYAADQEDEDDWYDDGAEDTLEGYQDFNKVEPYAVCLAGRPVKKFDYYEEARRFHDNWKKKLYREGDQAKADKITLLPLNLDETATAPIIVPKRRAQDKKDMAIGENQDNNGVERAILNRIMVAHTDLLMKFGPEKVMQAAEEVAYNVGDVDEIGTSDVSAYVAQVKQILGVPQEVNEKWSQKYKSSINCANPKGFSQKAHCAGRKK